MTTKIAGALWRGLPLQIRRSVKVPHTVRAVSALAYKKHVSALVMSELTSKRWNWLKWGGAFLAGVVGVSAQKNVFAENSKELPVKEKRLEDLRQLLSIEKIVNLRELAGKTGIAQEYQNKESYQNKYHINCKSKETFKNDLARYFPSSSLDEIGRTLATEKNYLLIFDGVDQSEMADEIRSLLKFKIDGHIIITGKYDLSRDFCSFRIYGVETKEGISVFRENLSLKHREIFDKQSQEDKEKLISLLKGSLPLIKIAAKELGRLWDDSSELKDLTTLIKRVSSLDPDEIYLLMGGAESSFADSVEAVRQCFKGRDLHQQMVYDVLYFYAFHFMQDEVLVPNSSDSGALRNLFISISSKLLKINVVFGYLVPRREDCSYNYRANEGDAIHSAFLEVTNELEKHGLILRKYVEGERFEKMTLFCRWWVVNHFYVKEYKFLSGQVNITLLDIKDEQIRKEICCLREKEKAKWLIGFVSYINQISANKSLGFEQQLPFLVVFFEWVKKVNLSPDLRSEIVNGLQVWKGIKSEDYKNLIIKLLSDDKQCTQDDGKRWTGHTMDDRGILFGEVLRYHPSIEVLALNGCHLSDEGVMAIADSLSHNKSLKILRLDWNSLVTSKGVRALFNALETHPQIVELSLSDSKQIGPEDVRYLIYHPPKQLKKINLSGSYIAQSDKNTLSEMAKAKNITILW